MNSDHYAQQLIQKYRLAIAIGVIQTKPESKSLDQHIADLKSKFNDDEMEDMAVCSDDFDIDFNDIADFEDQLDILSHHSDTILKDFNDVHASGNDGFVQTERDKNIAGFVDLNEINEGSQVKIQSYENDIQSTVCETQVQFEAYISKESLTDIDKTFCDTIALINQDEVAIDKACDTITKADKIQTMIDKTLLKYIHNNQSIETDNTYCDSAVEINLNKTANVKNTFCKSMNTNLNRKRHAKEFTKMDIDIQNFDQTTFDSQATELYTLHTLPEDYTHVSQSQNNNFDISNVYIKGINKSNNQDKCKSIEYSLPIHENNTELGNNIKDVNLVNKINTKLDKVRNTNKVDNVNKNIPITTGINISDNEKGKDQENTEFCNNFKAINFQTIKQKLHKDSSAKAVTENIENNTQRATVVKKSRNIEEKEEKVKENTQNTEFEYSFKDINLARKVSSNLDKENFRNIDIELDVDYLSLNTQADLSSEGFRRNNDNTQETQDPLTGEGSEQLIVDQFQNNINQYSATAHEISKSKNENFTMQVKFSQNDENNTEKTATNTVKYLSQANVQNTENIIKQVSDFSQNFRSEPNSYIKNSDTENITMQGFGYNQNENRSDYKKSKNDTEIESVSSEEISELVPFKVMEELNKVKVYINRRNERRMSTDSSLDSGFRSDSQGRSKSALQLSGNCIGQSAYCLYEHISQSPIVDTTQEIVEEISQVLGQLIDRLHEEESYPTFLEELLEHVNSLIRSIFMEEDMLLEKDEKIQRLFLLNKSIHIQKYSIEKLTDVLNNIHTSLTAKEELYELTNIQEVENLSYIFHILEVIIKRYIKQKRSEETQSQSQEEIYTKTNSQENYPKRTSISDIWRKKWIPNFKEESKLDSPLDKKCVFKKCSDVINKIVVGCLEGYSLVAFAALQCFNLLQALKNV